MKLAKVRRQSVQSLGRSDSSLTGTDSATPAALAAIGDLAVTGDKILTEYVAKKSQREGQQYSLLVSKGEKAFTEEYSGRDQIPVNEIPKELRTPEMDLQQTVPSASILPQLYEQAMGRLVEEASYIVTNGKARQEQLTKMREVFTGRLSTLTQKSAVVYSKQVLAEQTNEAAQAAEVDDLKLNQEIIAGMDISDAEKQIRYKEGQVTVESNAYRDAELDNDPESLQQAIDFLESSQEDYESMGGSLSTKQRTTWLTQMKTSFKRANAHNVALIVKEKARLASNLELNIDNRKADLIDIEEAVLDDVIDYPKRTTLVRKYLKLAEDEIEANTLKANAANSYSTGATLDPEDPDDIEGVRNLYQDAVDELANIPEDSPNRVQAERQMIDYGIDLAAKTNILPDQLKSMLRSNAIVGDSMTALRGAYIYGRLQLANPLSIEGLNVSTAAIYESVAAMTAGGMDGEAALEIARANVKKSPGELAILDENYRSEMNLEDMTKQLNSLFTHEDQFDIDVFGTPAKATSIQIANYSAIVGQFYRYTDGDMQLAQVSALKEFKRTNAGSSFATPGSSIKVMPYSPERMYGMSPAQIDYERTQIQARVNVELGRQEPNWYMKADGRTAVDLSYQLLYVGEDGLPKPLYTDGRRYKPDLKGFKNIAAGEARGARKAFIKKKTRLEGVKERARGRNK